MTLRVFVGCAPNGEDIESQMVLEHTIRKHASVPVEFTWMRISDDPQSPFCGWRTERWATPFSGFRWAVPELCGFRGRAIYMDSDCIAMADLKELADQHHKMGKLVLAKGGKDGWRFCVSLWDCVAARDVLPSIAKMRRDPMSHHSMIQFFKRSQAIVQPFDGNWNCIDGEGYRSLHDPDIKVIHYSSEAHQPHLKFAIPRLRAEGRSHWFDGKVRQHWRPDLSALFIRELQEAERAGYTVDRYQPDHLVSYTKMPQPNYQSHRWAR